MEEKRPDIRSSVDGSDETVRQESKGGFKYYLVDWESHCFGRC